MPTIKGREIRKLVRLFNKRGVNFYHACQYKDFKSYLELGGIPSRNLMERNDLPYTNFDTDKVDRKNGVWRMVFGNLQDFGLSYAQFKWSEKTAATPNPFGPILFVFNPDIFLEAKDVAICLRSAGGQNFKRSKEALPTVRKVNSIFRYEDIDDAPTDYAKAYIKYSNELRITFDDPDAQSPEVSCRVNGQKLSFDHLLKVIVDPYVINGERLRNNVRALLMENEIDVPVYSRLYKDGESRTKIKLELADLLFDDLASISEIITNEENSDELREWARRIRKGRVSFFYNRFAKYLRDGTLSEFENLT